MTAYTKTLILSLVLCLVLPGQGAAQRDSFFVIELGKFEKPSFDSFATFRQLGIVYEIPEKKEPSVVLLGSFTEKEEAKRIFNLLPDNSQSTAHIRTVPLKKRKPMRTVQLALFEVGTPIDWEGFFQQGFPVFAIQENDVLRITAGDFRNARRQQKGMEEIREKGFLKAYAKDFPKEMAIRIGTFETGKSQETFLLPSLLPTAETPAERVENPVSNQLNLLSTSQDAYPPIPPTLAKNSTQQLQEILKEMHLFQDSINGVYDEVTANAYLQFTTENEQWIKYTILGTQWVQDKSYNGGSLTQNAISMLGNQPEIALPILNSTNHPLAIGYLQLHKFLTQGPGTEISVQIKNAIETASLGKEVDSTYFEKTVSLGFENLPDILRGIAFLHQMYPSFKVPCWIFEKEPKLSDLAFTPAPAFRNFNYRLEHCEEFSTWSEIKTLKAITKDLSITPNDSLNTLSLLYHTGFLTDSLFNIKMEKWEQDYIQQVKEWTQKPGFPRRVGPVFQTAFYQSLIRLQAYYAAKNSPEEDALNLARASLRLLTGNSFEPEK